MHRSYCINTVDQISAACMYHSNLTHYKIIDRFIQVLQEITVYAIVTQHCGVGQCTVSLHDIMCKVALVLFSMAEGCSFTYSAS